MSDSKLLNTLIAVIPLFSIVLYLMGFMYYVGYLDVYGVENSLFPLPSDITLLYGFYALIPAVAGLKPVIYALVAMLIFIFMLFLAYMLASSSRVSELRKKLIAKKANANRKNNEIKQKIDEILEKGESVYYYFLGIFLILLGAVFLTKFAIVSGKEFAMKRIDDFSNQKGKWVMLYSSHSADPIKAQQVTCSNTHCAFWLGKEALILGHDKIEKVVAHNSEISSHRAD